MGIWQTMQAPIDYAADYRRREAERKAKREEYEREMREWEEKCERERVIEEAGRRAIEEERRAEERRRAGGRARVQALDGRLQEKRDRPAHACPRVLSIRWITALGKHTRKGLRSFPDRSTGEPFVWPKTAPFLKQEPDNCMIEMQSDETFNEQVQHVGRGLRNLVARVNLVRQTLRSRAQLMREFAIKPAIDEWQKSRPRLLGVEILILLQNCLCHLSNYPTSLMILVLFQGSRDQLLAFRRTH